MIFSFKECLTCEFLRVMKMDMKLLNKFLYTCQFCNWLGYAVLRIYNSCICDMKIIRIFKALARIHQLVDYV